jgi:hypothetical protein
VRPARATTTATWGLDSGGDGLNWRHRGACTDTDNYDPDWWHSPKIGERGWAIYICQRLCPVQVTCQRWAIDNKNLCDQAVYGGVYFTRDRHRGAGSQQRYGPVRPAAQQPAPRPPEGRPAVKVVEESPPHKKNASLLPHIDEIRRRWEAGDAAEEIAEDLGTSAASVKHFAHRKGMRRPPAMCGTRAGYMRHIRAQEKRCEACTEADRAYRADWAARKRGVAA